ncbi:MAG: PilZ domain-containing protein [Clostridia bacterium]|nr:PilZ domain-containing protein [Clostridia bacterium]
MNVNMISSILKEGMIVSTKISPNHTWYQNILYKCEDNLLYTSLINSYVENIIMIGTTITVKYANEFFEYLFEGVVSSINTDYPAHVVININKAEEMINTRTFPRYEVYLASTLKPIWFESSHFSVVTNLSLGGMAFLCKEQFEYGEELDTCIYLPGNANIVRGKGKVIRKNPKLHVIDYSMQFIEMDEDCSNIISSFITSLEDDYQKLQNNFFENIKKFFK